MKLPAVMLMCLLLAACGGSGSNQIPGNDGNVHIPEPASGTVHVLVTAQGPVADAVLYAAQFTLRLPAGVSVPTEADGTVTDGVVASAIGGSYVGAAVITPSSSASGPVLAVNIANPVGMTVGPLVTLTCTAAAGTPPTAESFTLDAFSARNAGGAAISDITSRLTLQTQ
ncbi:hypothetical protein [Geomonas oryzae]|uniref:hypothetical protein n=1 Tax=Geomonas oryzae TaxID=2364273 RepID=UPI00100B77E7|nr:hypothetical protein [Geomonas oryzae]